MRLFFTLIFFLSPLTLFSQLNEGLNTEERAYLFHVVKKSPILNDNFGRYLDYQGPDIRLKNQEINYDSIELIIINNPELLIIRKEEISKSAKGLISEAANKMALWELNKILLAVRENSDDVKRYENKYETFREYLMENLPPNAKRLKDEIKEPHPKLYVVMNPSLNFDDKYAHLSSLRFLDINDQYNTLLAINYAINKYVEERTKEIYFALGGKADEFVNVLVAAGDGSITSGILEEREKNEKGQWNKGLPKAVGLFPYQIEIEKTDDKKRVVEKIEPRRYTVNDFKTVGENRITNIHLDVWGYNSEKQTTVVIEKNGLNYHLFGSGETRFLSPDSSFSKGRTFQSIINELEFYKIAKLNDLIYGRRGFDYWIDYNRKKKDATELKIEKKEKEYSDLGYSPITTSSKPTRQVKKSKKRAIKARMGEFDGTPTTDSGRKERKKLQQEIVDLYDLFEAYKRKIADLEKEKAEAVDLMAIYQRKLDEYKQMMGRRWASFTEKEGIYLFEDSSTFDIKTQEFQFKPSLEKEDFEIRLIAIPETSMSKSADEVMLHINVMDAKPNYNARVNIELVDLFASDKWQLPTSLFTKQDSVALRVVFEALLNKKTPVCIIARGQGIGTWNGVQTQKDENPSELSKYPGNAQETKMDSTFVRLRKSELIIHLANEIVIEINSFTDPVVSSISITNDELNSSMTKYDLSKNDILSAYRTAVIMKALKEEINVLAGTYMKREEASIIIDRFNKEWAKTRISVGRTSFKLSEFE